MPRALLATNRPSVRAFLTLQAQRTQPDITFTPIPVDERRLDDYAAEVATATYALVDIGVDADRGVRLCVALRSQRPDLRIIAIVCCPRPTLASHIQALIDSRVNDVLDAHATPADIFTALAADTETRGTRIHLRQPYGGHALAQTLPITTDEQRLLERVALGWSDDQLGAALEVSARTIRTRLERLRQRLGVATRAEMAAWAGAHGLYRPERAA